MGERPSVAQDEHVKEKTSQFQASSRNSNDENSTGAVGNKCVVFDHIGA